MTDAAFHIGGQLLATSGIDKRVRLWNTTTWLETARFDWKIGPIHSVAFVPDGHTMAAGGDRSQLVIWDVDA